MGSADPKATRTPPEVSFEFFPPKTEAQAAALDETVCRLARFRPRYVSVTYGAGGTSQERSLGTVRRMHEYGLSTAAHLTCAGASLEFDRRDDRLVPRARHRALRGTTRRSAWRAFRALCSASGRLPRHSRACGCAEAGRGRRGLRIGLSRAPSAKPGLGDGDRCLEAQGRRRRRPRHHAVLLR